MSAKHQPHHSHALSALGDPQRRAIVELLRERSRSVREIADLLPISRPAVSRHLRLLKTAELVADEARGTQRFYRLNPRGAESVRQYLEQVWGQAAARFGLYAANVAQSSRRRPGRGPGAEESQPRKRGASK